MCVVLESVPARRQVGQEAAFRELEQADQAERQSAAAPARRLLFDPKVAFVFLHAPFPSRAEHMGQHRPRDQQQHQVAAHRDQFRANPNDYLARFPLSDAQREAVLMRDWLGLLRLGGNIYYTFKLAIFDGLSMQHVGAAMSGTGMTVDDFRRMMVSGGRPAKGMRSLRQNAEVGHG